MPLATDKVVFLHIPKTGGIWVKQALRALNLNPIEIGTQHEHFPEIYKYKPKQFFKDRLVFTIVRHPIYWYQSRWAFRVKHGWQPRHPLDWNTASNNFQQFLKNALRYTPDGWCNWLFDRYIDSEPGLVKFVGRNEFLVDDFIKVMQMAGHNIDEDFVRNLEPANSSDMGGHNSKYWAKYTPDLYNRIMAVESGIINRYYSDYIIDPKNLIEYPDHSHT